MLPVILFCLLPAAAAQCGTSATGYIAGGNTSATDVTWHECCVSCAAPCRAWVWTRKNKTGTCKQFTAPPAKPTSCPPKINSCRTGTPHVVPEPQPAPEEPAAQSHLLNTDNIIAGVVGAGIMCIISVCIFSIIRFIKYRKSLVPELQQTLVQQTLEHETAGFGGE